MTGRAAAAVAFEGKGQAPGARDRRRRRMPATEGIAERRGRSVFHCPYCHGYELDQGRIGVLAIGPLSLHHALMLPDWGDVTLFLDDTFVPDSGQRAALQAPGASRSKRRRSHALPVTPRSS